MLFRRVARLCPRLPVRNFTAAHSPQTASFSRYIGHPRRCSIIGAPLADGQSLKGVELGPTAIRRAGLNERLTADGWKVRDRGDIKFAHVHGADDAAVNNSLTVGAANAAIHRALVAAAETDEFCLTLGGDHSIAIGTISGILTRRHDTAVLWIDAHADINTPSTSASHNSHGMVLAFLLELERTREVAGFDWLKGTPPLKRDRIVYIGLRDVDAGEKALLRELNIKCFTMHDVDKYGIARVMERALDHVVGRTARPLHLSLDIDSIDPLFAPSTGTRVNGGLTYREAYYVAESFAATGLASSMDLVEVNPSIAADHAGTQTTVAMAVGLISSAMGNQIL